MFRLRQITRPGDLRVQVSKQSQQTATFETRFTPALELRFYPRRRAVTVTSASSTPACRGWAIYFGHGITRLALHGGATDDHGPFFGTAPRHEGEEHGNERTLAQNEVMCSEALLCVH